MPAGDKCPIKIPCVTRFWRNLYSFIRWLGLQSTLITDIEAMGGLPDQYCDEVETSKIVVMEFETDYQTYQDGSGNDQLFSPTLDVLDDSDTPAWKTTAGLANVNAETPGWDFTTSDDKFVVCCLEGPSDNLPKVDLLFKSDNDSGDEPANNSYIKGSVNISQFNEIGTADFSNNRQMTGIEFGNNDRYLDELNVSDCDLSSLDTKNTTAAIINFVDNNLTDFTIKTGNDVINQIIGFRNQLISPDLTGLNLVNSTVRIHDQNQSTEGSVTFEPGQEISNLDVSNSAYNAINTDVIQLTENGVYRIDSCNFTSVPCPDATGITRIDRWEISKNPIGSIDNTPFQGLIVGTYLANKLNVSSLDFSPISEIENLSIPLNALNEDSVTLPSLVSTSLSTNQCGNLNQVFDIGATATVQATNIQLSENGLTQANVDQTIINLNNDPYNGGDLNVGNNNNNDSNSSPSQTVIDNEIQNLVNNYGWTVTYWDGSQNVTVS